MQNKMIGIIGAMEMETEGLRAVMTAAVTETISGIRFTKGLLEGHPAVVATCGVGKVAAAMCAEAMILRYGVSALLNTGVAGGLAEGLVCRIDDKPTTLDRFCFCHESGHLRNPP